MSVQAQLGIAGEIRAELQENWPKSNPDNPGVVLTIAVERTIQGLRCPIPELRRSVRNKGVSLWRADEHHASGLSKQLRSSFTTPSLRCPGWASRHVVNFGEMFVASTRFFVIVSISAEAITSAAGEETHPASLTLQCGHVGIEGTPDRCTPTQM